MADIFDKVDIFDQVQPEQPSGPDPFSIPPDQARKMRADFIKNTATRGTRLKEETKDALRHPLEFLTGPTAPATSALDMVTRVAPESAGKLIPRALQSGYEMVKGQVAPIISAVTNPDPNYRPGAEMRQNALDTAGGALDFITSRLGLQGWNKAKEGFLTDPAGSLAAVTGAKELVKGGKTAAGNVLPAGLEESMYTKALKPHSGLSNSLNPKEISKRVNTGLNEGIPVTRGGLEKSRSVINDINQEVQSRINDAAAQNINISRNASTTALRDWRDTELAKQALPESPAADINSVIGEYESAHPADINIRQAQNFKQSLNKDLDNFYKALAGSSDKTASIQKQWTNRTKAALRDDIANQISTMFPEVKALNQREGALLQLNKSLDKAVNRIGQRDWWQLKNIAAMAKHPKWAITEYILNNPTIQSNIAIAIRKARSQGYTPNPAAALAIRNEDNDPLGLRDAQ